MTGIDLLAALTQLVFVDRPQGAHAPRSPFFLIDLRVLTPAARRFA